MAEAGAQSLTRARWDIKAADGGTQERLRTGLGVSAVTARALVCRGIKEVAQGARFLERDLADLVDPFEMRDMEPAVAAVERALERGEPIRVYGDYDVDGVCATALLVRALEGLGGRVDWYIPHRMDEGYGVNEEAVRQASAEGVRLLITVDCGSTATSEVALARELGMEVVVTDHHRPGDKLPEAPVLNPWREDCDYPFKDLAGSGVAFKLVSALARARGLREGAELRFLDLVCVGTVGDVVPLLGENRLLVQHGLERLPKTRKLGIAALMAAARLGGRTAILPRHVAFGLAPRINAAGRMEHARAAMRLLLTSDAEEARELAEALSEQNERRREEERETLAQAEEMVAEGVDLGRERVLVLGSEKWHPGVIGIVASRLVDRYHRPALLIAITNGMGKGSGRSVAALNLWEALRECAACLTRYGGHHYAAGFGVEAEQIPELRRRINEVAESRLAMADLVRHIEADAEAGLGEMGAEAVAELDRLAPFGTGNPRPVLVTRGLTVEEARRVGDGSHLALRLSEESGPKVGAIWFRQGKLEAELPVGRKVDVCYRPKLDEWQGRVRVQLQVEDIGVHGSL
ncbi:MAG: single-stranded-DNA-specific exonuclease RecJ [Armatimonadota bacterium]|nr:MAG: single-stranded-DNA-specific exonuclease RecJ [Armatimonadota bacterium]